MAAWRQRLPEPDRLLLAFTLPVLLVITAQGFVSRAHANWAATAYVAGTVLVTAALLRTQRRGWLTGSLASACGAGGGDRPGHVAGGPVPAAVRRRSVRPHARLEGAGRGGARRRSARRAGRAARSRPVITDDRAVTAELLYYMRDDPTPVLAWRDGGRPHDHYRIDATLQRSVRAEPVLLVNVRHDASPVTERFDSVEPLGERAIPGRHDGGSRRVRLFALSGFKRR